MGFEFFLAVGYEGGMGGKAVIFGAVGFYEFLAVFRNKASF